MAKAPAIEFTTDTLTDQELGALAGQLGFIKQWVDAVTEEIRLRLEAGVEIDNATLVDRSPNRAWDDESQATMVLLDYLTIDEAAPRKVLSPTAAEKAVGKKVYQESLVGLLKVQECTRTLKLK